ncbi:MAG: helix-turn-helix transcriptional regulator [Lachnospiraceae bacterium]|nr:helix-turn-helix transcriptional regulator [Lachnospiraceae bacterium]
MSIGKRIRMRREALKMSQEELALMIGYKSRSSINKIELDQYNLKQSKIKAIADALQTTPGFIMGWDEEDCSVPTSSADIHRKIDLLDKQDLDDLNDYIDLKLSKGKYKKK